MVSRRPVKIAYVTDRGFLRPTLVSVWSLIRKLSVPAELHFWGNGLTADDWSDVARVVAQNPRVTLHTRDIGTGLLEGASGPMDYISAATMGRLFIPRAIDGHVLYIDGDTIVTRDVSPLFDLDLGAAHAGVVRNYTILQWLSDPAAIPADSTTRLGEIRALMHPSPPEDYFNAGILLLNCDAIRNDAALLAQVEDVRVASAYPFGDQDHLNGLFRGNVRFLDIAWNLSWGRARKHRTIMRALGVAPNGLLHGRAGIIHFHGPKKPWKNRRKDFWSSRGRATLAYRRQLARYLRAFPTLAP